MNRWSAVCLALCLAAPAHGYRILWDKDVGIGTIGYAYTKFYSIMEDDEFWAPAHNLGSDLDGDGILEFMTCMQTGVNTYEAYIMDAATGTIEFSYDWTSPGPDMPQVIAYLDVNQSDGVREVLVQTIYRAFVISGGTSARAPEDGASPAAPGLLGSSAPNPFERETSIEFSLPDPGRARVMVFDAAGRFVCKVLDAQLPAGTHQARWDGRGAEGVAVAAGIYFAHIEADGDAVTQKMLMLK